MNFKTDSKRYADYPESVSSGIRMICHFQTNLVNQSS